MNRIIPNNGIHHIALRASDFERSLAFYTALGLTVRARWKGGESDIALLDIGNGVCIELFGGGTEELPEGRFFHLAIAVEDVDAAFAAAIAAGGKAKREPCDMTLPAAPEPIPARLAFVDGPDGESLEFFLEKK